MTPEQEALIAYAEAHGLMIVLTLNNPRDWMTPARFRESPIIWRSFDNKPAEIRFGDIDDALRQFENRQASVAKDRAAFVENARAIRPDIE